MIAVRSRPYYLGEEGLAWSPDDRFILCFGAMRRTLRRKRTGYWSFASQMGREKR
jgi:endonuclease YncB( thermonuclease family)